MPKRTIKLVTAVLSLSIALCAQEVQPSSAASSPQPENAVATDTTKANRSLFPRVNFLAECLFGTVRWHHTGGTMMLSNGKVVHDFYIRINPCEPRGTVALLWPKMNELTPIHN